MEFLKIIVFALIGTLLINLVNFNGGFSKNYGDLIRMAVVSIMMIYIVSRLGSVYGLISHLAQKLHMDDTYLNIVLKVVGIAYLAEFGAQLCSDAGEKAIGSKIQWVGKVMIFVIASPIILALVNLIADLV